MERNKRLVDILPAVEVWQAGDKWKAKGGYDVVTREYGELVRTLHEVVTLEGATAEEALLAVADYAQECQDNVQGEGTAQAVADYCIEFAAHIKAPFDEGNVEYPEDNEEEEEDNGGEVRFKDGRKATAGERELAKYFYL